MKDPQLEEIVDDFKKRQRNRSSDFSRIPLPADPLNLTGKPQHGRSDSTCGGISSPCADPVLDSLFEEF